MSHIAFETIDWTEVEKVAYQGETGTAYWKTKLYDGFRVRLVEYSENYIADHWCKKGHIVHCLDGEFVSELENGESFTLTKDMTYIVSDEMSSHKSIAKNGVKLLIIDGDFLK
jgi:quercetin dioxygenase-like cupin family protein